MKIEISDDQNTLTLNRAVYEAKPAIPSHGCHQCGFENKLSKNCHFPLVNNYCIPANRNDDKNIVWVKKYEN